MDHYYYVLGRRGSPATETAELLAAGRGEERIAPVFTTREGARRFASGWPDTNEIRRLDEIGLLNWLIDLFRRGVQRIAIDPEASPRQTLRRRTCSLALMLSGLAEAVREQLHSCTAAGQQAESDPLVAWHCERCNKTRRQLAHRHTPVCCGTAMQLISDRRDLEQLALSQR